MTHDPELVKILARAIRAAKACGHGFEGQAQTALAATDASGTHWVAPWGSPDKATEWENTHDASTLYAKELWEMWRDGWLAKQQQSK